MPSYNISLMLRIQRPWPENKINIATLTTKVRKVFPVSNAVRYKEAFERKINEGKLLI